MGASKNVVDKGGFQPRDGGGMKIRRWGDQNKETGTNWAFQPRWGEWDYSTLVGTKVRGRGKIDKICSDLFNALPDEEIAYWEQQCTADHSSRDT